ncbi:hypothetical protein [Neorhizobium sp. AL 9.2.2]
MSDVSLAISCAALGTSFSSAGIGRSRDPETSATSRARRAIRRPRWLS